MANFELAAQTLEFQEISFSPPNLLDFSSGSKCVQTIAWSIGFRPDRAKSSCFLTWGLDPRRKKMHKKLIKKSETKIVIVEIATEGNKSVILFSANFR